MPTTNIKLFVEFLDIQDRRMEVVIMVGLPASVKSTIASINYPAHQPFIKETLITLEWAQVSLKEFKLFSSQTVRSTHLNHNK